MFKEKIVEGLRAKSEIKRFGLSNEAIDRIASAREKTVTEESQVETVLTDAETMRLVAEELMKHRDQEITKRTEAQSAFDAYKVAHPEKGGEGEDGGGNKGAMSAEQIAELIKNGVAEGIKDIKTAFETFKSQTSAKEAKTLAKDTFYANKWTTKFKDEADDAWERASELNEAKGGNMTAEELSNKAMEYFRVYTNRKGTDVSKPFESEGEGGGNFDFSAQAKYLEGEGLLPEEKK